MLYPPVCRCALMMCDALQEARQRCQHSDTACYPLFAASSKHSGAQVAARKCAAWPQPASQTQWPCYADAAAGHGCGWQSSGQGQAQPRLCGTSNRGSGYHGHLWICDSQHRQDTALFTCRRAHTYLSCLHLICLCTPGQQQCLPVTASASECLYRSVSLSPAGRSCTVKAASMHMRPEPIPSYDQSHCRAA